MDIKDRVAIVTGGASGIGRALCFALADAGAGGVVVADVDGQGAAQVSAALTRDGLRAIGIEADLSQESGVQALTGQALAEFGRIDLVCSNAGIIVAGGTELPDEIWSKMWAVNVHSHVALVRAVLPAMLDAGAGYFVFTASAAGLLTQLGSAPYAVTKHAVVALAEWLSITYGGQGIGVSCLCPQAVATNLGATSAREAGLPAAWPAATGSQQAAVDGVLTAEQVAGCVLEALADERFLILPHPEVAAYEQRRAGDRERWLAGMRRLQARLSASPD